MTTSYPLSAVLMQMTSMLVARNLWLNLDWIAREENQSADDLTNNKFDDFSLEKRLEVVWSELPLEVLALLVKEGNGFLAEIEKYKADKRAAIKEGVAVPRKRRRTKQPWG